MKDFNAPGYPRAYNYYNCFDYFAVIDKKNEVLYEVTVVYKELQRPTETEYKLEEIDITKRPLISEEKMPFTAKLVENLLKYPLREPWNSQIRKLIYELAEAEISGNLNEKLKEIKERAKNASWVYEYSYLLSAITQTEDEVLR